MNYSFKLSRRLARFRAAGALATVVLTLSCSDEPSGPGPIEPAGPSHVSILPDTVSIGVNDAVQFNAATDVAGNLSLARGGKGRGGPKSRIVTLAVSPQATTVNAGSANRFAATATLSDGSTASPKVSWAATGGTIDSSGLYTASNAVGTFAVIATVATGAADTAAVTVAAVAPVATRLALSPGSDTLSVGATAQFVAVGKASDGTTVGVSPSFTATGGTVTPTGLYTAGQTAGKYRVIAADQTTGLADTAAVTISPEPITLQSLAVTPATISLASGKTQQFAATGTMSDGSTSNVAVKWTVGGGTISAAGVYTAGPTAGAYRVIAADTATGRADTAAVTITTATPTLQAVVITPATVSLATGATQVFSASGRMSDGSTGAVGVGVTWSATGGTVSSAGVYAAGQTAGSYRVIATAASGPADTSSVTITAPSSGGLSIAPGDVWQAKVDANPAGTVFRVLAGTHIRQTVTPKSGDQFLGDPGAIMDGQNTAAYAFRLPGGCVIATCPTDVTIKGLVITRYNTPVQYGAINAGDHQKSQGAHRWTVENNEIRDNAAAGIRLGGRMQVLNNNIHHNGQIGLVGYADSAVIQGNELAWNNYQKRYTVGFEAGGFKIVGSRGVVVRSNYAHDNWGPGLWMDGDNIDALYEGNRVEDNAAEGIFHEISFSAVIRNNIVKRNGLQNLWWYYGAGIFVSTSSDVEVYGNTVEDNGRGIVGVMQNRGTSAVFGVPWDLHNLYVHDNDVTMTAVNTSAATGHHNATGVAQDVSNQAYFTSKGNRFVHNTYHLGGAANYFTWGDRELTEAAWKTAGQDVTGTFSP